MDRTAHGTGVYGALNAAQTEGRTDLDGSPLSLAGKMAILKARAAGVTDPDALRAAARAAEAA